MGNELKRAFREELARLNLAWSLAVSRGDMQTAGECLRSLAVVRRWMAAVIVSRAHVRRPWKPRRRKGREAAHVG